MNHFVRGETVFLPLYEGKLVEQFDHRHSSFQGATESDLNAGNLPQFTETEKQDPLLSPLPRYWVGAAEVEAALGRHTEARWFTGFREVSRPIEPRTATFSIVPRVAVGHKLPLIFTEVDDPTVSATIVAMANSLPFDYLVRQKQGGAALSYFIVKQLPVIPPSRYEEEFCGERLAEVVAGRVLELVYTAWDIRAFALDLGDEGPPFVWDEERRAQLRAQLDAIYFHLYGIERADVEYIMSTFPIVERKDRAAHGCYRTRDLILGYYDAYARGELEVWLGPEEKREARRCPSPGPSPFRGGEQG